MSKDRVCIDCGFKRTIEPSALVIPAWLRLLYIIYHKRNSLNKYQLSKHLDCSVGYVYRLLRSLEYYLLVEFDYRIGSCFYFKLSYRGSSIVKVMNNAI